MECGFSQIQYQLLSTYMGQFSLTVPNDFLHNAASVMLRLSEDIQINVLHNLTKEMGTHYSLIGVTHDFPLNKCF